MLMQCCVDHLVQKEGSYLGVLNSIFSTNNLNKTKLLDEGQVVGTLVVWQLIKRDFSLLLLLSIPAVWERLCETKPSTAFKSK